jgi:putative hydroxymethylpyrimidine transport system permease protein
MAAGEQQESTTLRIARGAAIAAAIVAAWQAAVWAFAIPHYMLPGPDRVVRALLARPDLWQVHAVTTLIETVIGLALGAISGVFLALVMSFLPPAKRLILPVMIASQAIPVFAIAPLLVLWFGYGMASKIVMATIAIFFPIASAFHDGLTRTDTNLLDLARLSGASRAQEVRLLRLPAALPSFVTGMRVAAVYAPIGALIGEWVGASSGLGYAMLQANGRAQTDVVFAALFILALMAVLVRAAVDLLTRDLTPWAAETR